MSFNSPHKPGSELWCEALSNEISARVDADTIAEYREDDPGRWHLGASEIGNPCSRRIWYSFRWILKQEHSPALHRLFQRGHDEEHRFVHRLRRIGLSVWDRNPDTGDQFRMEHPSEPHYGGSLDGVGHLSFLPERYSWLICEFKTHNAKSFEKLVAKGVRLAKPQHYAQMCSYGEARGYYIGLYCAVNKNTDDLYWRVVPLQHSLGQITTKKAKEIIRSQRAPTRISENSAHVECKFCPYRGPCHLSQPIQRNCRSCAHGSPNATDREWSCALYGPNIPRSVVVVGCDRWTPVA